MNISQLPLHNDSTNKLSILNNKKKFKVNKRLKNKKRSRKTIDEINISKNVEEEKIKIKEKLRNEINNKMNNFNSSLNIREIKIQKDNIFENVHKKKVRNPGVDMVRILGMLGIIIHHILLHGKVMGKYRHIFLSYLNKCLFWHVSSFALISGVVGYRTCKYSNLIYLWLCTLFYQVTIHYLFLKYDKKNKISNIFFSDFLPVLFYKYWYFTAYFGMYLLLPIITKGLSYITKVELIIFILTSLGIFIVYKDYNSPRGDPFFMNNGYSSFWLLIFFMVGAYIGKYNIIYKGMKKYCFCLFYLSIYIISSYLCCKLPYYPIANIGGIKIKIILFLKKIFVERINSITMILQSISISLFFIQINYNKYISKIICFFGPLTFGVYLIHEHELFRAFIIGNLFSKDPINLPIKKVITLVIQRSIYIFLFCSLVDFFRKLLFDILRIRTILLFIEKNIFKLFNLLC